MEENVGDEKNGGEKKEQLGVRNDESKEEEMIEYHKAWYKKRTCTICNAMSAEVWKRLLCEKWKRLWNEGMNGKGYGVKEWKMFWRQ